MNKLNEMLDTLQKSVGEIAAAPEEGRAELLEKTFTEFREAVEAEGPEPREVLAKMGASVIEEAGLDDPTGAIAEFAGVMASVEGLLDRLAETAMQKGDGAEGAAAIHEAIDGWYGLGVRILEVAAATGGAELPDLGEDDVAQIGGDLVKVADAIGIPLEKAVPPQFRRGEGEEDEAPEGEGEGAPAEGGEGEEEPEVDDSAPLDPLDTLQRLLAAALVTVDAIRNADGAPAEEEEEMEAEEEVERAEKAVLEDELAKAEALVTEAEAVASSEALIKAAQEAARAEALVKAEGERRAREAAEARAAKAEEALKKATEEAGRLKSMPAPPKARLAGAVTKADDNGGAPAAALDLNKVIETAKEDPSMRTNLFKAALSNPIRVG